MGEHGKRDNNEKEKEQNSDNDSIDDDDVLWKRKTFGNGKAFPKIDVENSRNTDKNATNEITKPLDRSKLNEADIEKIENFEDISAMRLKLRENLQNRIEDTKRQHRHQLHSGGVVGHAQNILVMEDNLEGIAYKDVVRTRNKMNISYEINDSKDDLKLLEVEKNIDLNKIYLKRNYIATETRRVTLLDLNQVKDNRDDIKFEANGKSDFGEPDIISSLFGSAAKIPTRNDIDVDERRGSNVTVVYGHQRLVRRSIGLTSPDTPAPVSRDRNEIYFGEKYL